ncbi:hypothetical protein ACFTAO_39405 [Paenibacillus rhizoplanae]
MLEDINLEIEAGKSYLIVGLNGSGKKQRLSRCSVDYMNLAAAKILVDGVDIRAFSKKIPIGEISQWYFKISFIIQ